MKKDKLTTNQKKFLQEVYRKKEGAKYVFEDDPEWVRAEKRAKNFRRFLLVALIGIIIAGLLTQC